MIPAMRRWRLGGAQLAVACLIAASCSGEGGATTSSAAAQSTAPPTVEASTQRATPPASPTPAPTESPVADPARDGGPCELPDQVLPAGEAHIVQRQGANREALFAVLTADGLLDPIVCPPRFAAVGHLTESSLLVGDGEGSSAVLVNVGGRVEQRQVTDTNGNVVHPENLTPFNDEYSLLEVDGELLSLDHELLMVTPVPNVEGRTFLGTGLAFSTEASIVRTDAGYHVGPKTTPADLTFVSNGGSAWDLGPAHFVISSLDGASRRLLFVEAGTGEIGGEVPLAPTAEVSDTFGPLIGVRDGETVRLYGPTGQRLDDAVVADLSDLFDRTIELVTTGAGRAFVQTLDGRWASIEADGTTRSVPSLTGARVVDAFQGYFYLGADSGGGELIRVDSSGAIDASWAMSEPARASVVRDHHNGWISVTEDDRYRFVHEDGRTFVVPEETSFLSAGMDDAGSYVVRNPGGSEIAVHLVEEPLSEILRFDGDLVGHLLPS